MGRIVFRRGVWVLVAVLAVITTPRLVLQPSTGVDPSWHLGLHLARDHGLIVGHDLVFNYGPWGFLGLPLALAPGLWLAAVAFRLLAQVALFSALGLWMRRNLDTSRALIAVVPVLLFLPLTEYRWLLALGLWLALYLTARTERPLAGLVIGAAAAVTVLIKFSMGVAALMMVAGGVAAGWYLGRSRSALTLASAFAGGFALWGLLALGSIEALIGFLAASIEISAGYNAAMERQGPLWQPLLVLGCLLVILLGLLRDRCKLPAGLPALVLPFLGLLLITFKHAFVRHGTHGYLAFCVGTLGLTWIVLAAAGHGGRRPRLVRAAGLAVLLAGALVAVPPTHVPRLPFAFADRLKAAAKTAREIGRPEYRARLRERLQEKLPLAEGARAMLEGHTVDILTVEVAMVEAWDLDWRPRPVLQSYAVATAALDELDAEFFAGASAPERLLVDLQGLDTRHPFMDAPRTWRQILSRYRPLGRDTRWLILGLREQPRTAVETRLQGIRVPLNRIATVPEANEGHLEMHVRLRPTLLGRLISLPWKVPEVRLGLLSSDTRHPRRILAATSDRPFPLTRNWPETPDELGRLFDQQAPPAPPAIGLFTNGSWAWRDAEVDFVQVVWDESSGRP